MADERITSIAVGDSVVLDSLGGSDLRFKDGVSFGECSILCDVAFPFQKEFSTKRL